MRQLRHEGWMHNRGRLLTASFLTKTLYVDWRIGARHFLELLVDGDIANNQLNWQWVAGTGTDTRPNRVLNPVPRASGTTRTVRTSRRWVPELAGLDGAAVHEPWKLKGLERARLRLSRTRSSNSPTGWPVSGMLAVGPEDPPVRQSTGPGTLFS